MMSLTCTFSVSPMKPLDSPAQVSGDIFSELPITASTSSIAAKLSGSICAAQPVTMTRASGFSRRRRRISCRALRTASAVTAQVLTTTASPTPASSASAFIASVS